MLYVKVRPNARKTKIVKESADFLEIDVAAPAESGKANSELIRFLEKKFGKRVKILRGKTSRKKVIVFE